MYFPIKLCAFFAAAASLGAQNAITPTIQVTTRLVTVSVIATDHQGRPVGDLQKKDLTLEDNGVTQSIATFSLAAAETEPPPPQGEVTFSNRPAQYRNDGLAVILFDGLNTLPADLPRARGQLAQALAHVKAGEQIALYDLERELFLIQDLTADTGALLKSLEKHGIRVDGLNETSLTAATGNPRVDSFLESASRRTTDFRDIDRARETLSALEEIANRVKDLPGRKDFIWITGGFPFSIGSLDPFAGKAQRERRDFSEDAQKVSRLLNEAQVVVYAVSDRGLELDPNISAARHSMKAAPRPFGDANRQYQSLELLAKWTGGKSYLSSNDTALAIGDALNDSRSAYSLQFYPTHKDATGAFHTLSLKVDRAQITLRYRAGYFASASSAVKPAPRNIRESLTGPPMEAGIGLSAAIKTDKDGYKMTIAINARDLALDKQGDRWRGALDLYVISTRRDDKNIQGAPQRIVLNLSETAYQEALGKGFRISTVLHIPAGADQVTAGVQDANNRAIGTLFLQIHSLVP